MAEEKKTPETKKDVEQNTSEAQPVYLKKENTGNNRMEEAAEAAQKGAQAATDSAKQAFVKVKERSEWSNPFVVVITAIVLLVAVRVLFGTIFDKFFGFVGELLLAAVKQGAWPIVFAGFIIYYRKEIRELLNRLGRKD